MQTLKHNHNLLYKLAISGVMMCAMFLSTQTLAQTNSSYENLAEKSDYKTAEDTLSEAELAQALAPIALYPDSLLTHILIAATYPLEVVQAQRWLELQGDVETDIIMQRVEGQSWDPSVQALVAFPNVLERLNDDLEWTQTLGDAFLQDEGMVLDSIQILRQQADAANAFDDVENVTVTKTEQKIIIEPAQKEIVYVPYYDTRVVYGNWYWASYPPVYWRPPVYPVYPVHPIHRPIYWGPGIHISFNYYFSAFHWHSRRVVVVNHRYSHKYRPPRKIAYSTGAKRWAHKPQHRRGVAYRSAVVSKRYQGHYAKPHTRVKPTHAVSHNKARVEQVHRGLDRSKAVSKPSHYANNTQKTTRESRERTSANKQQTKQYNQPMSREQVSRESRNKASSSRDLSQPTNQSRPTAGQRPTSSTKADKSSRDYQSNRQYSSQNMSKSKQSQPSYSSQNRANQGYSHAKNSQTKSSTMRSTQTRSSHVKSTQTRSNASSSQRSRQGNK
ncbi:DUF3300 domain-containing protein [Shewanella maritima]|uniref:DUF3300 domain-containing protein n=1 Tax=Shewanella maritima TaxID=2520507 RepID=UPI0037370AC0